MTTKYLGDGIWVRRTNLDSADIMMPTERQATYGEPLQALNAVSVPINNWSYSSWIDVTGFDKVGINVNMTSGTGMTINLEVSFDGVNYFSAKQVYDGTATVISEEVPINAPFIRLAVKNKDASATKTTSSWLFFKA